jgi:hypothetical protein
MEWAVRIGCSGFRYKFDMERSQASRCRIVAPSNVGRRLQRSRVPGGSCRKISRSALPPVRGLD